MGLAAWERRCRAPGTKPAHKWASSTFPVPARHHLTGHFPLAFSSHSFCSHYCIRSHFPPSSKGLVGHQWLITPSVLDSIPPRFPPQAITTLRVLADQVYLAQCSSRAQSEGVVVEVTAAYVGVRNRIGFQGGSRADPGWQAGWQGRSLRVCMRAQRLR